MPDGTAIDIRGLSKTFGDTVAVDDVTFAVMPGEVFGFMGHNGAGKTTTIRMLLGLLRPTGGSASVLDHDIVRDSLAIRQIVGYLPGDYSLPREMTARQFLRARVAIIHHGRLIASGALDDLKRRHGAQEMDDLYLTLVEAAA